MYLHKSRHITDMAYTRWVSRAYGLQSAFAMQVLAGSVLQDIALAAGVGTRMKVSPILSPSASSAGLIPWAVIVPCEVVIDWTLP